MLVTREQLGWHVSSHIGCTLARSCQMISAIYTGTQSGVDEVDL